MEQIAEIITNYGFSVVLLAWLIFKDYKFNDSMIKIMQEVKEVLTELRTWHSSEEAQK